jgi:hypothetical protein
MHSPNDDGSGDARLVLLNAPAVSRGETPCGPTAWLDDDTDGSEAWPQPDELIGRLVSL